VIAELRLDTHEIADCSQSLLDRIRELVLQQCTTEQLAQVYAMSPVDRWEEGRYRSFAVFAAAPRPKGADRSVDARVAADELPLTTALRAPAHHGSKVVRRK
jgi:hypothetical protein